MNNMLIITMTMMMVGTWSSRVLMFSGWDLGWTYTEGWPQCWTPRPAPAPPALGPGRSPAQSKKERLEKW